LAYRRDHPIEDRQQPDAVALGVWCKGFGQGAGFADQVRPTAKAQLMMAVSVVAVGHQPAGELTADDAQKHLFGPSPDGKEHGVGIGDNPQPQELAGLVMRRLIGIGQRGVLYFVSNLLGSRRHCSRRCVNRLGNRAIA
jgi:hypothetical protein